MVTAQDGLSATDEEARSLFTAGQTAFEAGRFERALEYFERAYELSHRPGLLYNIGVAADRLRHDERALEAFEAFLASGAVEDSQRATVEARAEALRRAIDAERRSDDAGPTPTPPPTPPPTPSAADPTLAIALLIAGGVVLAGGGAMLGIAASEDALVQGAPPMSDWSSFAGHHDAANALAISGGVTLGVGVVLAVIGALVWPSAQETPRSTGTTARLDARGLELRWRL